MPTFSSSAIVGGSTAQTGATLPRKSASSQFLCHARGRIARNLMTLLLFVLLAALVLALIPLVPELVRLRIRFLRWIRWTSAADVLDNHFAGWCWFYRAVLGLVAIGLLFAGWAL